jgi:hypothetical protein
MFGGKQYDEGKKVWTKTNNELPHMFIVKGLTYE